MQGLFYVTLRPLRLGQEASPDRVVKLAEIIAKPTRDLDITMGVAEGAWTELIATIGNTAAAQSATRNCRRLKQ